MKNSKLKSLSLSSIQSFQFKLVTFITLNCSLNISNSHFSLTIQRKLTEPDIRKWPIFPLPRAKLKIFKESNFYGEYRS